MEETSLTDANTVAIVTGAAGEIGIAFLNSFATEGIACIGISHRPCQLSFPTKDVDLNDTAQTSLVIKSLGLERYDRVVFVHTVGRFEWEEDGIPSDDQDGDGINDEVYKSNVLTFENVVSSFASLRGKELTICNIASISDKYSIPWWKSYSKAKNLVRKRMQELASADTVRAVSLNVSTVKTGKECGLRPFADQKYWLEPQELAARSIPYILHGPPGYIEVELFKEQPEFDPIAYYLDPSLIKKRWMEEMGK